jgi:hypothetical protein
MAKISYQAGEAILRGQLVQIQADDTVDVYNATDLTLVPAAIAFEDVASGDWGTFWAPGSTNVYAIASGSVAAGDIVSGPGGALPTVEGSVGTITHAAAASGSFMVGIAQTDATDGNPVYVSFVPSIIK